MCRVFQVTMHGMSCAIAASPIRASYSRAQYGLRWQKHALRRTSVTASDRQPWCPAARLQARRHTRASGLEANRSGLVNYGARYRRGEPISTAFVESAINEIVARRMIKKQQMRWNRWTVQPFLDVRVAILDGTLEASFRRCYPEFSPANDIAPIANTA